MKNKFLFRENRLVFQELVEYFKEIDMPNDLEPIVKSHLESIKDKIEFIEFNKRDNNKINEISIKEDCEIDNSLLNTLNSLNIKQLKMKNFKFSDLPNITSFWIKNNDQGAWIFNDKMACINDKVINYELEKDRKTHLRYDIIIKLQSEIDFIKKDTLSKSGLESLEDVFLIDRWSLSHKQVINLYLAFKIGLLENKIDLFEKDQKSGKIKIKYGKWKNQEINQLEDLFSLINKEIPLTLKNKNS